MKTKIATSLINEVVRLTMGLNKDEAMLQSSKKPDSPHECWRHLGEFGVVRAVWVDTSGPECTLELADGTIINTFVSFVVIATAKEKDEQIYEGKLINWDAIEGE